MKIDVREDNTDIWLNKRLDENDINILKEYLNNGFKPDSVFIKLPNYLPDEDKINIIFELYNILALYKVHECYYDLSVLETPNFIESLREETGYFYSFYNDLKGRYVSKVDYDNAEEIIKTYVSMIQVINPTPLEAILYAAYIVGGYQYNEGNPKWKARNISTAITNEQIVCVGYSKIFTEVLRRLGIKSSSLNSCIKNDSNDYSYSDHETSVVLVDDDTYDIHDSIYNIDVTFISKRMYYLSSLKKLENPSSAVERETHLIINELKERIFLSINQKEHNLALFGINTLGNGFLIEEDTADNINLLMNMLPDSTKEDILNKFRNAPVINGLLSETIWNNLENKIGFPLFDEPGPNKRKH